MSCFFPRYFEIMFENRVPKAGWNYILHHFKLYCLWCNNSSVMSLLFLAFFDVSLQYHRVHRRRGIDTNSLIPVSDTPSFAITRLPGFGIPIVEGMSVSLKCEVDSNPASTPIWQRGKWWTRKKEWNSRAAFRLIARPAAKFFNS